MCRWGDKLDCNGLKRDFGKWRQSAQNTFQLADGNGERSIGSEARGRGRAKGGFHSAEKSTLF